MKEFTNDFKTGMHPYKERAREVLIFLKEFAKHPVDKMKALPDWEWGTLLIFYSAAAAIGGVFNGLIATKISLIISGLILFPISATLGAFVLSGFYYYTFLFMFHREVPLKRIFTVVIVAMLPFFAVYAVASLLEPAKLVGIAAAGALMIVGLSENTEVPRKRIFQMILTLYIVYFLFWAFNMISWRNQNKRYKDVATPASLEQLKKEFED